MMVEEDIDSENMKIEESLLAFLLRTNWKSIFELRNIFIPRV
jgi:hypothetical protein